jgi:hypothetical protein|tara:strand:- start:51 stop:170 length:120 start_codon:yes stop_codon:yes gene_type:complete
MDLGLETPKALVLNHTIALGVKAGMLDMTTNFVEICKDI